MDPSSKLIIDLIESFPSIARFADHHRKIQRFDSRHFAQEVSISGVGSGARCAASFILMLWDGEPHTSHPFNLVRAIQCWDSQHLDAFQKWAADPRMP